MADLALLVHFVRLCYVDANSRPFVACVLAFRCAILRYHGFSLVLSLASDRVIVRYQQILLTYYTYIMSEVMAGS